MVSTPVRHFATGVFIPPAKVPVTTLCNVVDTGRLALPHIPVQVRWRTGRVERGPLGPEPMATVTRFILPRRCECARATAV